MMQEGLHLTSNALLLQETFTHAAKHKHTLKPTGVYLSEQTKQSFSFLPCIYGLQRVSIGSPI